MGKDSSKKLKERTDENSQLRESTTEEIDYQMQEDVTIESASLTKQEFDFASSKVTTKEINDVINEIEESNAIVFSKMNNKLPLWYYQPKVVSLYIYTLEV
ncbi:hypothetical protein [Wolbachia endosymbiont of Tetranychus urticae]|uniref:hypothetical protein n=1 Tax=Wolbachia endosymbiont of Tetranychus urticae TaxID=169184 RepID=UPI00397D9C25